MPIFDKTMNYSLGDFFKNGVKNSNCSYFAYMYVYMLRGSTAKMSIIACLVFLKMPLIINPLINATKLHVYMFIVAGGDCGR